MLAVLAVPLESRRGCRAPPNFLCFPPACCPPLILHDAQIDDMFDRFGRELDDMAAELKAG